MGMHMAMSNFDNDNSNSGSSPPNTNPILTAYDSYRKDTPMITRAVMSTQAVAYIVNLFFDSSFAFANKPVFTVYKFEVYRIVTSLFICSSFFSLIIAYFSFVPAGKRLEFSTGSTEFACNFLTIGVYTNVLYLVFTLILDSLVVSQYWLIIPSFGLWNSFFGLISMECTKAPRGSMRKVLFFSVPTIYYPLALWGMFTLMSGFFSLAHLISIGLGYGFGYGYLERFKISRSRCKLLEETYLENFASQERGFVVSSIAMGSEAWSQEEMMTVQTGDSSVSGLSSFFSRWTSLMQQETQQYHSGSSSSVAMGSDDTSISTKTSKANNDDISTSTLPVSGGQQLGGRSRRHNTDPRQARLQAIEQRMCSVDTNNFPI